jgi:2,4-dienoyl-CoA reductase-like NADH-dependent reductase (Old Yellow Enzyme family)
MSILFEPIELNGMIIPNRIVRSATNDRRAELSGELNQGLIDVYEALAAGGVGLIITGHAYVTWNGKASPEMIGVHSDDMNPMLKQLVDTIHKYDSKIVIQLNHAGRQTKSATIGETPVAPSAVFNPMTEETSRELSAEEIDKLIDAYVVAAERSMAVGFDGVQIHCAHGYLGSQFISPYTNKREDEWGGSIENRMRFPLEIYRRIRKAVGENYPVMIKLNSEDSIDGGLTIEDSAQIAKALSLEGIDAIEISGGMVGSKQGAIRMHIKEESEEAYYLSNAREFKKVIDAPLMLVGGMRSPGLMEKLLQDGEAEMVSLCRPLIREPDLANRWKRGDRRKADCISCGGCQKYPNEPVRCILLDK